MVDAGPGLVSISSIRIGDKDVTLPAVGVTAIVGGNNVGKSALLREVRDRLGRGTGIGVVGSTALCRA